MVLAVRTLSNEAANADRWMAPPEHDAGGRLVPMRNRQAMLRRTKKMTMVNFQCAATPLATDRFTP